MMDIIDWSLYRSFLAVLETGSLSAAGRRLRISQPTMGRHIRTLETALGKGLFFRTPDGLSPTDAALALMPHARALADAAGALTRAASGDHDAIAGIVRIAASEVTAAEILPPILRAMTDRWPDLTIELAVSNSDEDVMRRAVDIAVRMAPPRHDALIAKRIGAFELGLFAHPAYLRDGPLPQRPADLARHRLVGFDRPLAYTDIFRVAGQRIARDRFALRSDSDMAQLAAIRAGCGIGVCHVPLSEGLVRLLPADFAPAVEMWLLMHPDLRPLRRFDAVLSCLTDALTRHIASPVS